MSMGRTIAVIPGDGIGEEITKSAVAVLEAVSNKMSLDLAYEHVDAGGTAYDKYGVPLPESTVEICKKSVGVLFGAVGGTKWDNVPAHLRPEQAILGLRKQLGLYANLRPIKVIPSMADFSPLKSELVHGVDLLIIRELIGGIYFGEKKEFEVIDNVERAWDVECYSVPEIERIARLAFATAKIRRNKITSVDKANVLASSRLWRNTINKISDEYKGIELEHLYVDNAAMQLVSNPKQFDVLVTGNLFGDILSDEAAVVGGSIGLMPSASIGVGTSLFEPIHGSAPDIAGKGIANPLGTILSAALLLRYSLQEESAATVIEQAVDKALADGYRTRDICSVGMKLVNTEEMTQAVIDHIK